MAIDVGAYWGFWGDSQTDGRAPAGTCHSSPDAIESTAPVSYTSSTGNTYGSGGRSLDGSNTAYDSYGSKSGLTWVHFQESGDQNNTGQTTASTFGTTFEAVMTNISTDSPDAVISYETAFSFGREAEPYRDWTDYNTQVYTSVETLAGSGITVIVADVDTKIKALQSADGMSPSDVWYQDGEAAAYHYTALGNFMVALTVWDALGYDVNNMDLSGVTDVSSGDKAICLALFDSEAEVINILAENDDFIVQEDDGNILTEDSAFPDPVSEQILAENDDIFITEDSNNFFSEGDVTSSTLLPINLTQSQAIDSVILTQKNTLDAADLAQAMSMGSPVLTTLTNLIVQNLNQAHTVGNIELVQYHNILVNNLTQSQTIENISLTLASLLNIASLIHNHGLSGADLIQQHHLNLDNLSHSQTVQVLDLVQHHNLIVSDLSQSTAVGNIVLTLADVLAISNMLQAHGVDNVDVLQAHSIAVNNLNQSNVLGSVEVSLALLLDVAGLAHAHSLDALSISQVNVLAVDNLGQSHDLGTMSLTQANELLINDLSHSQYISTISFVTAHGKVTVDMSMKIPGMEFDIKTSSINFRME